MTAIELTGLIKERLGKLDSRLHFDVVDEGVRQDNEWWYVPVIPEMQDGRLAARDFSVNVLAGVETELHESLGVNVLFIPATR